MWSRVRDNHNSAAFADNPNPFSFSLLPAPSMKGIIFSAVHKGTYDGPAFVEFIQQLLQHMNLWLQVNSVLIMDNFSIHHLDAIVLLCGAW